MKKLCTFIFYLTAILMFCGGCKFMAELKKPKKKKPVARKPVSEESATLPDGTVNGLNKYEMEYVKDIEKDFKRRQQINSRKVFGGSGLH